MITGEVKNKIETHKTIEYDIAEEALNNIMQELKK